MGEPACLMRSFSHPSERSREAKQVLVSETVFFFSCISLNIFNGS